MLFHRFAWDMKTKKILLINSNEHDIEIIQRTLDETGRKHSVHVAKTGRDALNALMGSSGTSVDSYFRSRKTRPNIILLNKDLPDMTSSEFLQIVRKYYSLLSIKIFLLIGSTSVVDLVEFEKLSVAGVLSVPIDANRPGVDFQGLRTELDADDTPAGLMDITQPGDQKPENGRHSEQSRF